MEDRIIYTAFGLNWYSNNLLIPELNGNNKGNIDVFINTKINNLNEKYSYLKVVNKEITMNIAELANFRMLNGKEVIINMINDNNKNAVRSYLLGTVMGSILVQRNYLLFHANALEKSGKVIVCMGKSGIGKSTISYILMNRGWKLLSDDLVSIDEDGMISQGIPRIKLCKDTIDAFNIDFSKLKNLHYYADKYVLDHNYINLSSGKHKISEVYFLDRDYTELNSYKNLNILNNEKEKLLYLKKNIYRPELIKGSKNEYKYFLKTTKLAKELTAYVLTIPNDLLNLEEVICEIFN